MKNYFLLICIAIVGISSACSIKATQTAFTTPEPVVTSRIQKYTGEFCPTQISQAEEFYTNAIALGKQGQIDDAQAAFQKAIELDENFCDAMSALGVLFRLQGDMEQAIHWYKQAIEVSPNFVAAHQNLGFAYRIQGNTTKAIEEYELITQLDAENPEGYYGLGSVYLDMGKYQEAIVQIDKAKQIYEKIDSPALVDAQVGLGVSHFYLEEFEVARDYFELAYSQRGNEPLVNYFLGLCYLAPEIENLELAKQYLTKAQELGASMPSEILHKIGK